MELRPRMIITMGVLTMSIRELSVALSQMAAETPELTFEPHPATTLVSDEVDVSVTTDPRTIRIAEPIVGQPRLAGPPEERRDALHDCLVFLDSLEPRREKLRHLTNVLFAELPDFPSPKAHLPLPRLAEVCDWHITTVARTIQDKVCQTPYGHVPYNQFITSMRQ